MKICLAQTRIWFEEKEKNLWLAERLVRKAAGKGAELILFPEMSFTGFSMNTGLTGEKHAETSERMLKLASENGLNIGFGWVEKSRNGCLNHYSVTGADGRIRADYAKIHPFSFSGEDRYFRGGDRLCVFEMDGIRMALFICYDLRFPELFRAVCEAVSVIITPANWPAKRSEHWKTLLRARAIENQVYILGVNCQGDMNGQYYSGDSCIFDPNGDLKDSLSDREGMIFYDLEDDVERFRAAFPVLKDRRKELYQGFNSEKK